MKITPGGGGRRVAAKSQVPKVMYSETPAAMALRWAVSTASSEMSVAMIGGRPTRRSCSRATATLSFQICSGVAPKRGRTLVPAFSPGIIWR